MGCEVMNMSNGGKYVVCDGEFDNDDAFEMAANANNVSEWGVRLEDSNAGLLTYNTTYSLCNKSRAQTDIMGSLGLGMSVEETKDTRVSGPLIGLLWSNFKGNSQDSSCPLQLSLFYTRAKGQGRTNQLSILSNDNLASNSDIQVGFEASLVSFSSRIDGFGLNFFNLGNVMDGGLSVGLLNVVDTIRGGTVASLFNITTDVKLGDHLIGLINLCKNRETCHEEFSDYAFKLFHCGEGQSARNE